MHSLITVEDKHFFTCGFSSFFRPFVEMEFLVVSFHQVNWNYCFSEVQTNQVQLVFFQRLLT